MTSRLVKKTGAIALAAGFLLAATPVQQAQQSPPQPGTGGPAAVGSGGGRGAIDPRVQQRMYTFADTNEQLPYAVFVSSKVSKDKKNPLIIALHGLGGDQNTMMRPNALQLAEEGGYIVRFPSLPDLITEGDTLDEARAMAADLLQSYLELLCERGRPLPPSDPVSMHEAIRVPLTVKIRAA